jgi:hypothetical protein
MKTTCDDCETPMTTDKPPTPLQFATTCWLAVLREHNIHLQLITHKAGRSSDPTPDQLGEALEATRAWVREWDAETELEKLGAEHGADFELRKGTVDYEVLHLRSDNDYGVIGAGRSPAEAVADAERGLS